MASLDKHGRIVIPAPVRRALEVGPGDELVLTLDEGELRITSRDRAVALAQETIQRRAVGGGSMVDELIAERRAEAGTG